MITEYKTILDCRFDAADGTAISDYIPEYGDYELFNIDATYTGTANGGIGDVIITGNALVGQNNNQALAFGANLGEVKQLDLSISFATSSILAEYRVILLHSTLSSSGAVGESLAVRVTNTFGTYKIELPNVLDSGGVSAIAGSVEPTLTMNPFDGSQHVLRIQNDGYEVRAFFIEEPSSVASVELDSIPQSLKDMQYGFVGVHQGAGETANLLKVHGLRATK